VKYRDLEERLLANSVPVHTGFVLNGEASECWEWIGNRDDDGYARLTMRVNGKHKKLRAHRVSHEEFKGVKLTDELTLEHLCRYTSCIHPDHTVPMSNVENVRRMQQYWRNYRANEAGQAAFEAVV
jgi:hypothetical protein